MRKPHLQSQRGQALVFTLAFAVVLCLAVLLLFNNSKLANAKTSLQNAADAAAYSAAVLQARDHNFSAYTNRAMIANQVAVAQFVSLKSYLDNAAATRERMTSWKLGPLSLWVTAKVVPASKPRWNAALKVPIDATKSMVNETAPLAVKGINKLIQALAFAQHAHHVGILAEMTVIAQEVVKKNHPDAQITKSAFAAQTAMQAKRWATDYTQRHRANDDSKEADRFADAVLHDDSQDGFTRNRSGVLTAGWHTSVARLSQCITAYSSQTTYVYTSAGGTLLSKNKKRWEALDATQGGGMWKCDVIVPLPPFTASIGLPILDSDLSIKNVEGGSAGVVAGEGTAFDDFSPGYKNNATSSTNYGFALTSTVSVPALLRYNIHGPNSNLDSSGGLQTYYRDMASPTTQKPKNQTAQENGGAFPITIEVERKVDKKFGLSSSRLPNDKKQQAQEMRLDDKAEGSTMRTLASAHAYFYRPREDKDGSEFTRSGWHRSDNKTELANLFSPYWQARLTETPQPERAASIAAQF